MTKPSKKETPILSLADYESEAAKLNDEILAIDKEIGEAQDKRKPRAKRLETVVRKITRLRIEGMNK